MSTETLTLQVPSPVYEHLKQRAAQTRRSVEEETLEVLAMAVPPVRTLPAELEAALASLQALDDAALREAAQCRLAVDVSAALQSLHHKRQREGLTDAEAAKLAELIRQYERHMLVRAQAAALLKTRGRDISGLMKP
jgi:plasmid stability protein